MSYFDDNEDRIIYGHGHPRRAPDVACKRCGKTGLRWEDDGEGGWLLLEGKYRVHKCDPDKVRALALEGFEAVK